MKEREERERGKGRLGGSCGSRQRVVFITFGEEKSRVDMTKWALAGVVEVQLGRGHEVHSFIPCLSPEIERIR